MHVEVRCYGGVRAITDARSVALTLPQGATVATLIDRLGETYPRLARLPRDDQSVVVMRDRIHLSRDATLADGDVVSLSTPPMPE